MKLRYDSAMKKIMGQESQTIREMKESGIRPGTLVEILLREGAAFTISKLWPGSTEGHFKMPTASNSKAHLGRVTGYVQATCPESIILAQEWGTIGIEKNYPASIGTIEIQDTAIIDYKKLVRE